MAKKFWIINSVNATTAEILLYGFIGQYEAIDDASFITDLRTLEATYANINIRVNCGGGDVYKGLTIFNAIQSSKAHIKGFIDGIAASMGAVVVAACRTVEMSKYGRYMTHRVSGYAGGNADDLRSYADEMEVLETTIATILAKRTGLTTDETKTKYITNKDRWISADQALTEKLIDGIYDAEPVALPETETDPQKAFNAYHKIYNISSQKQPEMQVLATTLGLPETATETEINAAIVKLQGDKTNAENAAKATVKANIKAMLDTAQNVDKKFTTEDRPIFEALAEANFDAAVAAIAKIPAAKRVGDVINMSSKKEGNEVDPEDIDSWEKLVAKGESFVAEFKKDNATVYNKLLDVYKNAPVKA